MYSNVGSIYNGGLDKVVGFLLVLIGPLEILLKPLMLLLNGKAGRRWCEGQNRELLRWVSAIKGERHERKQLEIQIQGLLLSMLDLNSSWKTNFILTIWHTFSKDPFFIRHNNSMGQNGFTSWLIMLPGSILPLNYVHSPYLYPYLSYLKLKLQ